MVELTDSIILGWATFFILLCVDWRGYWKVIGGMWHHSCQITLPRSVRFDGWGSKCLMTLSPSSVGLRSVDFGSHLSDVKLSHVPETTPSQYERGCEFSCCKYPFPLRCDISMTLDQQRYLGILCYTDVVPYELKENMIQSITLPQPPSRVLHVGSSFLSLVICTMQLLTRLTGPRGIFQMLEFRQFCVPVRIGDLFSGYLQIVNVFAWPSRGFLINICKNLIPCYSPVVLYPSCQSPFRPWID